MSPSTTSARIPLLLLLLLWPRVSVRALDFVPPSILTTETTVHAIVLNNSSLSPNCSLYLLNEDSDGIPLNCENNLSAGSWKVNITSFPVVVLQRKESDLTVAVEEALAVICCQDKLNATLLVQASIWPMSARIDANISLVTALPNPAYVPLSLCPCDLTLNACDVGCCCDNKCKTENGSLLSSCLPGVFGGLVSPPFEHLCSEQQAHNAPDWFPFLCVQSPAANSPTLGLFHADSPVLTEWDQIPGNPSFAKERTSQTNVLCPPMQQGSPTCLSNDLLTLPQATLGGECIRDAPVSFLKDVTSRCVLHAPLKLNINSLLSYQAYNGNASVGSLTVNGDVVNMSVIDGHGVTIPPDQQSANVCMPADTSIGCAYLVSMTYEVTWKDFEVKKVRAIINLSDKALSVQEFSVRFRNPVNNSEIIPRSGNPGYLVGKPLLTRIGSNQTLTGLYLWDPVGDSLCTNSKMTQVKFGENSMSGCLFPTVHLNNCSHIRANVLQVLKGLVLATMVGRRGNSNPKDDSEWVEINNMTIDPDNFTSTYQTKEICTDVPAHLHIRVLTAVMGNVEREPQMEILAVQVNISMATWQQSNSTEDTLQSSQSFHITSSVQFIRVPAILPFPQTRFQLNYTEFDCSRNDVCWPELALPFITTYKGHPDGYAITQGMILVLLFVLAGLLAAPWHAILT